MRSSRMTIWVMVVVVFVSGQALGWTQYNDGGTHDISTTINDDVWVDWETPGAGTTVNVLNDGVISSGYNLQAFENSRINMSGGFVDYFNAYDSSQVTMSGGFVDGYLYAYDSSQVTMSDGSVDGLRTYDNSQVTMSGGKMYCGLVARNSSQVTMSGGSISYLDASDSSQVTMSGGTVGRYLYAFGGSQVTISGGFVDLNLGVFDSSQVTMSGGTIAQDLLLGGGSILELYGSDFTIDGTPVDYGNITSILGSSYTNDPYRTLTGTLLNGDIINNQFRIGDTAYISLEPVPEPATLLLLGLSAAMLRRERRAK